MIADEPGGTIDLLLPKPRQNPDCLTPAAILPAVVRGNKLVERRGDVAIYEGPHPGAFEVIIIRIAKESLFNGRVVPRREVYPSAEAWGTYGWTYSPNSHPDPLKAARAKMQQLTRTRTKPATDAPHNKSKPYEISFHSHLSKIPEDFSNKRS